MQNWGDPKLLGLGVKLIHVVALVLVGDNEFSDLLERDVVCLTSLV